MKHALPLEKKLKKVTEEINGTLSTTTTFQPEIMCNERPTKFS